MVGAMEYRLSKGTLHVHACALHLLGMDEALREQLLGINTSFEVLYLAGRYVLFNAL